MGHTDLNFGAVMWEMKRFDELDVATKYKDLGEPDKFEPQWLNNVTVRMEIVRPMAVPLTLLGKKVYLGDFGESVPIGNSREHIHPWPPEFCAPESYHESKASFASDMWAYMYIFTTLYYRCNAPYYSDLGGWSIVDAWVRTFGPLPKDWHSKYNYYGQPCKNKWYDQTREPDPKVSLKVQVAKRVPAVDQREQDLVLSVLEKGFR
jgi:serine/threonine protein kinase